MVDRRRKKLINEGGEKKYMRIKRNEKGITLIALIITIIILVILAAVSIRTVTNMGIVGHAINGTQDYAREAKAENEKLDTTGNFIDNALGKLNDIQGENGGGTTGLSASDISNGASTYYGATVNYPVTINTSLNDKWKIFYADESNIFLIPDSYISVDYLPVAESYESLSVSRPLSEYNTYCASFELDFYGNPLAVNAEGSSFLFSSWTDYSSTGAEWVVGALLHTDLWSNLVDSDWADCAIGGPTLEMWCASWNSKGQDYQHLYWDADTEGYGYYVGTSEDPWSSQCTLSSYGSSSLGTGYYDSLYFPDRSDENPNYYYLASPAGQSYYGDDMMGIDYNGWVNKETCTGGWPGFRPIVRLRSAVLLTTSATEGYDFDLTFTTTE